jgi:hypothetical protein
MPSPWEGSIRRFAANVIDLAASIACRSGVTGAAACFVEAVLREGFFEIAIEISSLVGRSGYAAEVLCAATMRDTVGWLTL